MIYEHKQQGVVIIVDLLVKIYSIKMQGKKEIMRVPHTTHQHGT